jgi:hypothetical protein
VVKIYLDDEKRKKLEYFVAEHEKAGDDKRVIKRLPIIISDPDAPLCINCVYCEQQGFLFICTQFLLPEDGKVVGESGIVYYSRKGHISRTYLNTPMKGEDCELFIPLIPPELFFKQQRG